MSKAFVKEGDSNDDDQLDAEPAGLPAGEKNYITPAGAKRLQEEFRHLSTKERPEVTATVSWAASNGDRSENADYQYGKKKLREIDRRLRFLSKRLQSIQIVDPLSIQSNQIRFGATVTIKDEKEVEKTYSIVGIDEVDVEKGRISWVSPLAKALLRATEGDVIEFAAPGGMREIEVIEVKYIEIP